MTQKIEDFWKEVYSKRIEEYRSGKDNFPKEDMLSYIMYLRRYFLQQLLNLKELEELINDPPRNNK